MGKSLTEMASEIVAAQASHAVMAADEMVAALKKNKQLTTRTLAKYGLTPAEYRKKWGFSARQPLASKALSAKRRKTAKALGLGERLQEARKAKAAAAAKAKAKSATAAKAKAKPKKKRKAARKKKKA
jgi:predicted transcriptional regulator